ncbi:SCP-like protein [Ancylostoma caninum]|uniref:SCP-like protein n=1 Tax=Ancylostoma caninum TaxID=29170 RepID=A0A368GTF8_ANCCA|nr:SCP-like protein [Ancylostoma caninum]
MRYASPEGSEGLENEPVEEKSVKEKAELGSNLRLAEAIVYEPRMLALGRNTLIPHVVSSWYSPVMIYGQNANNKFDDPRLEEFANIAYDKNLGVGCYYAACPNNKAPTKAVFSCVYNTYVRPNQVIYETGTACVHDSQCTTYPNSICLDELCVTPAIVPLPPTPAPPVPPVTPPGPILPNMCPGNAGLMTDVIRTNILQMHNWRRSQLAFGNIKNGKNDYNLPTASNMYKMAYDCNLEKDALVFASKCSLASSPQTSRVGQGENVHVGSLSTDHLLTGRNKLHAETPAKRKFQAVQAWWSQVFKNGLNQKVIFTTNLRDKPAAPTAFTQMGWAKSVKLGCAIVSCPTNMFTVCRYSEKGNIVNQQIYIPGTPCAACPGSCIVAEGLCATP